MFNIYRKIKTRNDFIFIIISFFIVLLLIFVVPEFFPNNYYALTNYDNINSAPTLKHIFGTDYLGRDVFIRVLIASKLSLQIAFITSIVSVLIGTIYGVISGYFGGKIDTIMMRIVDGLYAIPFIFLSILLVAIFGRNFFLIFIAIGCVSWLDIARVMHIEPKRKVKYSSEVLLDTEHGLRDMRLRNANVDPYPKEVRIEPLSKEEIENLLSKEDPDVATALRPFAIDRDTYSYDAFKDSHYLYEFPDRKM